MLLVSGDCGLDGFSEVEKRWCSTPKAPGLWPVNNNIITYKMNQGALEKWPILALRQETHKMSLEHLIARNQLGMNFY